MDVVADVDVRSDPSQWPLFGRRHAVALGVFDGIHLGHQAIIERARLAADTDSAALAVVTFDPHPAAILRPEKTPATLTDFEHKLELLDELKVDTVVVVKFDRERSEEAAEDFVSTILVGALGANHVVVGNDFHFGRGRKGDVGLLERLGRDHDFAVEGRPLSRHRDLGTDEDEPISSTAVRHAVAGGDVELAAKLLGRPHEIRGSVVQGDQRGRTIGFPTANIAVPGGVALPADGVYAGWWVSAAETGGSSSTATVPQRWPCAVNVGKRPTFYENAEHSVVEAHLIDWHGDLYGVRGGIQFVSRLRSERKFDGLEALTEQLQRDIDAARNCLHP